MRDRILYANAKTLPLLLVLVIALMLLATIGVPVTSPSTSSFFSASYAELRREDGEWVVYTDGRATSKFAGSFRVCATNAETARHYWTCEWSDPIDYAPAVVGATGYMQPETLEWWANIPDSAVVDGLSPVSLQTCWRVHLGGLVTEPLCVVSRWDPPLLAGAQ